MPPLAARRTTANDPFPVRLRAGRAVTLLSALLWGVLFFGVIDLMVVPTQDARFDSHYLLETGWGLLYTLLVMVPLALWAVNPRLEVFGPQVLATADAILFSGVVALAAGQVAVAGSGL